MKNPYIDSCLKPLYNGHFLFSMLIFTHSHETMKWMNSSYPRRVVAKLRLTPPQVRNIPPLCLFSPRAQMFRRCIALSTGKITIKRTSIGETNCTIHWIATYLLDSAIQPLNNWGLLYNYFCISDIVLLVLVNMWWTSIPSGQGRRVR